MVENIELSPCSKSIFAMLFVFAVWTISYQSPSMKTRLLQINSKLEMPRRLIKVPL
jgi:hypothetical protein